MCFCTLLYHCRIQEISAGSLVRTAQIWGNRCSHPLGSETLLLHQTKVTDLRKNRRSVLVVLNASVWNCDRFTPISMHLNAFRHLESRVQHQKGVAQKILIVRLLG